MPVWSARFRELWLIPLQRGSAILRLMDASRNLSCAEEADEDRPRFLTTPVTMNLHPSLVPMPGHARTLSIVQTPGLILTLTLDQMWQHALRWKHDWKVRVPMKHVRTKHALWEHDLVHRSRRPIPKDLSDVPEVGPDSSAGEVAPDWRGAGGLQEARDRIGE
jgi:hypothetical protein